MACFSPSLSTETKCWHHGTNSSPMWNNLIPLIMLEMLKKNLGQGAEYGAYRNPCCSIWTPESICFPLLAVLILDLFSLLIVVSFTVSTRKHTSEVKRTLCFYTMTSETWLVLGPTGPWVRVFFCVCVCAWLRHANKYTAKKKRYFLKTHKPKPQTEEGLSHAFTSSCIAYS